MLLRNFDSASRVCLGWLRKVLSLFKETVHSEIKICEKLDYCTNIQQITLIFPKSDPTFLDSDSVSKICTYRDLHRSIWGPASEHPRTCIRTSGLHHFTITLMTSYRKRTGENQYNWHNKWNETHNWWNDHFWVDALFKGTFNVV